MNRKRILLTAIAALFAFSLFAQPSIDPVVWTVEFAKAEARIGETVDLVFTAPLKEHHHIYTDKFGEDSCGPIKTNISFDLKDLKRAGALRPIDYRTYMDEIWSLVCTNGEVKDFEGKAHFRQAVKITGESPSAKGSILYQVCNDEGCRDFTVGYAASGLKVLPADPQQVDPGNTDEDPAVTDPVLEDTTEGQVPAEQVDANAGDSNEQLDEPVDDSDVSNKSLWALFLLGLGGGLLALFTPCVFPMIPMTVAFFTKEKDKAKGRRMAVFYGFSIVLIYIVLGMLLAMLFGATFAYTLSTHWLPNILFFLIFVFFALSFLGMFELTLPAGFVNKMDRQGDRGGYVGVFFIAFTLVLVSFSCTAPIVGSVSILASSGAIMKPLAAMLGFSLMFAIPFTLFAFFPQWLNSMPQSGGWLNSVKVFLGFAELALAFKFLSQADLVYHWGILDRDVFIAIWIVLAITLGIYFLGKIKFPHDSEVDRLPVPRFLLAVACISFGVYLVPGLFGAPLKPLSGILPPMTTQDFYLTPGGTPAADTNEHSDEITYSDILHLPHGLQGYFVYEEALAASKKYHKPVFVDFTGHSCANCRKMEEYVWVKPEVLKRLRNDVIIASLYVDERKSLPKAQQYVNVKGEEIRTIGQRNADLQINTFNSNAQPFYYIVDSEGKVLQVGGGYDPDEQKFIEFLDAGIAKFAGS